MTHHHLQELCDRLTLEQKVALVTGADFWTTVPIEEIGLRAMTLSDGPAGVRGPVWDERSPSLNLPNATSLAASWDRELAHSYGAAAAAEAQRKGVDVVLGPTINLHRTPLGGRTFECFSEDPLLTAELAVPYVKGMQENGIAACPKHYVANDSESERFTVDVVVDEKTLRELYMYPFERAVVDGGAWTIMSSYNSVNGTTMTENDLLESPLNTEWGFDGVVVSDWTAVRSTASAAASQDLEMPGPQGAWGQALLDAVAEGSVSEAAIDRKVVRLLRLAERVGALEAGPEPARAGSAPQDPRAFTRLAATEGMVLLRNETRGDAPLLPRAAAGLTRVAVIGHNARDARTQGGGSATVLPEQVISPLDGLRAALPDAEVTYSIGAVVQEGVAEIPLARMTNPRTGEPGVRAAFLDADGTETFAEDRRSTALVWFGGDAPIAESATLRLELTFTPEATERVNFGFATGKPGKVWADGALLIDDTPVVEGTDLGAAFLSPPSLTAPVDAVEGQPIEIVAEFELSRDGSALDHALSVTLGLAPPSDDPDDLIAAAVAAARPADFVVIVVGTNSKVESEGFDRSDLNLPGRQDDLVRAVAAANPNTVVVVNAGAPVLLPWRDEVGAIVLGHFGGQEFGAALADVLTGDAEPGGRLTSTWPGSLEEAPVTEVAPREDGTLPYEEGLHIGFRAWMKTDRNPAWEFGAGSGYTSWSFEKMTVAARADGGADVTVAVTNTGDRAGKQVVQVYAERPGSAVDRPSRWLAGFGLARLEPGASAEVAITVPARVFEHWDGGWQREPGAFTLRAGSSVRSVYLDGELA